MQQNNKLFVIAAVVVASQNIVDVSAQIAPTSWKDNGYFDPKINQTWQAKTALQKLTDLWAASIGTKITTGIPSDFNWDVNALFTGDLDYIFSSDSEEMPLNRKKTNHAQGLVGLVTWEEVVGQPYTGLYKGKTNGLLRFSEVNFAPLPETRGLTPAVALKFPLTKIASVNYVANTSFEPSTSWNFFKNDFKVSIPLFTGQVEVQTIERRFLDQKLNLIIPRHGLSRFSRFTVAGTAVTPFVFPFDLRFAPDAAIRTKFPDTRQLDAAGVQIPWYTQLQKLTATVSSTASLILFQVYARNKPNDIAKFPDTKETLIANIRLTTPLIASTFGDKRLFFKHEGVQADLDVQPSWSNYVIRPPSTILPWGTTPILPFPTATVDQKASVRGQLKQYNCPFAWLLGFPVTPIY